MLSIALDYCADGISDYTCSDMSCEYSDGEPYEISLSDYEISLSACENSNKAHEYMVNLMKYMIVLEIITKS